MHLLIAVSCDVSDAILFTRANLGEVKVGGGTVHVCRYKRKKTGQDAVVPISSGLAEELMAVPAAPNSTKEMPFRTRGISLKADQNRWSRRVMRIVVLAGGGYVVLPNGKKKPANVKQFRHTAAVRLLCQGQRVER